MSETAGGYEPIRLRFQGESPRLIALRRRVMQYMNAHLELDLARAYHGPVAALRVRYRYPEVFRLATPRGRLP
jgi:hypothetical protein